MRTVFVDLMAIRGAAAEAASVWERRSIAASSVSSASRAIRDRNRTPEVDGVRVETRP
jgi:hypothetical protein